MGFFSQLEARARRTGSLLCVGLDPHVDDLPPVANAQAGAAAARDFCRRLIEATAGSALAFKPNAAFFEVFGAAGWQALQQVVAAVPDGIPVVLDAKRGDIASTAVAYAQAAFSTLGAGAITASPYLGHDSLEPMLRDPDKGVFLLCKTSNPGSADVQDLLLAANQARAQAGDLKTGMTYLYEEIARLAVWWNTQDNLGLVVGATHPQALQRVRVVAPELWILAPGVGAQGGDLENALRAGLRRDGLGLLLPVSRALSRAATPRQAAQALRAQMAEVSARLGAAQAPAAAPAGGADGQPLPLSGGLQALADGLLELGCVKFGQFTLKSGLQSPIYLDLRRLVSAPGLMEMVGRAYLERLQGLEFDRLAALPYAALPIGAVVGLLGGWPLVYPRKEAKAYGTRAEIEGDYAPGERVVVLDDLATTGESKFEAIEKLTAAGLVVQDVVVLIDRQSGAAQALAGRGYRLHAVLELLALLDYWQASGKVPAEQLIAARRFVQETGG